MRKALLALWLLAPAAMAAVHYYGPGKRWQSLDDAGRLLSAANQHLTAEEWAEAVAKYDEAIGLLPPEKVDTIRQARLARNKARMFVGKLPQSHDDLAALLDELSADPKAKPEMVRETRAALSNAQYYMTWLLRLEGFPEAEWSPYIEGARQNYKLLAEGASSDAEAASKMKEDLDSSIRLARMDLSELQALPLPSQ